MLTSPGFAAGAWKSSCPTQSRFAPATSPRLASDRIGEMTCAKHCPQAGDVQCLGNDPPQRESQYAAAAPVSQSFRREAHSEEFRDQYARVRGAPFSPAGTETTRSRRTCSPIVRAF